ncbi:hypothetical protein, partial [uncultured Helicobacter sp.]|uniref:hypothetical protein n=1 Tax=uncultured Helicobacter sp. TaxID=175537 RepID=UPI0037523D51
TQILEELQQILKSLDPALQNLDSQKVTFEISKHLIAYLASVKASYVRAVKKSFHNQNLNTKKMSLISNTSSNIPS